MRSRSRGELSRSRRSCRRVRFRRCARISTCPCMQDNHDEAILRLPSHDAGRLGVTATHVRIAVPQETVVSHVEKKTLTRVANNKIILAKKLRSFHRNTLRRNTLCSGSRLARHRCLHGPQRLLPGPGPERRGSVGDRRALRPGAGAASLGARAAFRGIGRRGGGGSGGRGGKTLVPGSKWQNRTSSCNSSKRATGAESQTNNRDTEAKVSDDILKA